MNAYEPGILHSLDGRMSPDLQVAFHIFAAHWRKVDKDWHYPVHTHPMFEINVVLQGSQQMIIGGQTYHQQSGDILFIRPGVSHSSLGTGSGEDMTYYCLHFDIDDLILRRTLMTVDTVSMSGDTPELRAIRASLDAVISSTILSGTSDAQRSRLVMLNASLQLFTALSGWVLAALPSPVRSTVPGVTENTVALANAIEGLLQESVFTAAATGSRAGSIEDIAAKLGYSPNHCNRAFRQIYGLPPRQYLSDLIIRHAKLLLLDNSLSVERIAHRLGYRDVSHFSKQFKRWTGLPPMGYRQLTAESEPVKE
ncbi:AraC family transcriptional regulator [Paenibacillus sp. MMS20-IR301]|uniref:AraC family transcriptional regulator n=1 Tax=Paenibacillus sp. MMS20-IR301 TaxID=2895946 RepID=UPI0028E4AB59|nr:AraC family transcriptional regulator [Paenibacillus sp. MMS20-IR301]WNS44900.1 AraC family transcriptional regulator [Paenibacillus sp. MMS20-IR301]